MPWRKAFSAARPTATLSCGDTHFPLLLLAVVVVVVEVVATLSCGDTHFPLLLLAVVVVVVVVAVVSREATNWLISWVAGSLRRMSRYRPALSQSVRAEAIGVVCVEYMLCGGCEEQEKPDQKKKESRFREITGDGSFARLSTLAAVFMKMEKQKTENGKIKRGGHGGVVWRLDKKGALIVDVPRRLQLQPRARGTTAWAETSYLVFCTR